MEHNFDYRLKRNNFLKVVFLTSGMLAAYLTFTENKQSVAPTECIKPLTVDSIKFLPNM